MTEREAWLPATLVATTVTFAFVCSCVCVPYLRSGHNGRISPLGISCLEAMSSLICAGPIFHNKGLDPQSSIYTWLENMLICPDTRVQSLGQRTVQMLLMVNSNTPCLINWVVDRCIQTRVSHLCFHALSKTLVEM